MCFRLNTTMVMLWLVCCTVAVWGGGARAEVDQGYTDTILLYIGNFINSSNIKSREYMYDRPKYKMRPHQKVTLKVIVPPNITYKIYWEWKNIYYAVNKREFVKMDDWDVFTITLPDIGNKSGYIGCFQVTVGLLTSKSVTYISIGEGVDEYVNYNRSLSTVEMTVPLTPNVTETLVLSYGDNTSLSVMCTSEDMNFSNIIMYRICENKSKTILSADNKNIVYNMEITIYLQNKTYNDNVIGCSITNTELNETSQVEVRLKYREEWRPIAKSDSLLHHLIITMCLPLICMMLMTGGYYWSHRGKKAPAAGSSRRDRRVYDEIHPTGEETAVAADADLSLPRSGTPDSNIYEPIYDDVYEDRLRIARLHTRLQQETNISKPPSPPPVESIPLFKRNNEALPLSSHHHTRLPSGSMIPKSDLYRDNNLH